MPSFPWARKSVRLQYGHTFDESQLLYIKPLSSSANPTHFAIFLIKNKTMLNNTSMERTTAVDDVLLLLDENQQVIWSNLEDWPIKAASLLANRAQQDGYGRILYEGTRLFLSEHSISHGLTLIHLTRNSEYFARLSWTVVIFTSICLFVLVVGLLTLMLALQRGYRPLRRIVDALPPREREPGSGAKNELELLQTALAPGAFLQADLPGEEGPFSNEQLCGLFVLNAIQGRHVSQADLQNLSTNLEMDLSASYHFVCCILINPRSLLIDRDEVARCLKAGTAQETRINAYFYVGLDGRTSVGILPVSTQNVSERVLLGHRLLASFPQTYNATVAVGCAYADLGLISRSYLEARAALDYRFIKGAQTVIATEDLPKDIQSLSDYPTTLLQAFAGSVRTWDDLAITRHLAAILQYIENHNLPLYQAKSICYELASTFLREATEVNRRAASSLQGTVDIFALSEFDSYPELARTIKDFSEKISAFVDDNARHKDLLFIKRCEEHFAGNLGNHQFSIDAMADHMGLSPQYLRKRYKALTGHTLSETLTEMRIARAKERLSTTQFDINAIIAEIGYLDVSSFIRKFKSATGVTPGKYREQHRQ